jgi:hypothetical protein
MTHERQTATGPHRPRFHWVELLITLGIAALLAALFLPGIRHGPGPASPRTLCVNNLKNIGLAVLNYEADYGALPPAYTMDAAGQPLHSWRTLLLPYLDQAALYERIDLSKPWDDPANAVALETVIEVYQCPHLHPASNLTTYAAMAGPDAFFLPTESRRLDEITDGTANTLMLIELPPQMAFPWMAPRDGGVEFFTSWSGDAQLGHGDGTHVMFADIRTRLFKFDRSPEQRAALITIDGGEAAEGSAGTR